MIEDNIDDVLKPVLANAKLLAFYKKSSEVKVIHVLKDLLSVERAIETPSVLLRQAHFDLNEVRDKVDELYDLETSDPNFISQTPDNMDINEKVKRAFLTSNIQARLSGNAEVDTVHLMLSLFKITSDDTIKDLKTWKSDLEYKNLYQYYKDSITDTDTPVADADSIFDVNIEEGTIEQSEDSDTITAKKAVKDNKTPFLDEFATDLTEKAKDGKLDPVIGRSEEIHRTVHILSRKRKNNPVLIGEPGVGKTAIVEGIALRIISGEDIPSTLLDKRLLTLDVTSMVAGSKFRGEFEMRIKGVIEEAKQNPNIILFIDEIHTIVGAGNNAGGMDAANILKPALSRGEIRVIGATTFNEYREGIESDKALERRFQKVQVDPTSESQTLEILKDLSKSYSNFHAVEYSEDSLKACVDFSVRYVNDRFLPDKAIDIMDEVGAKIKVETAKKSQKLRELEAEFNKLNDLKNSAKEDERFEEAAKYRAESLELVTKIEEEKSKLDSERLENKIPVTVSHVAEVVSNMVNIPVTQVDMEELDRMKNIDEEVMKSVIGQDEAVKTTLKSIKRSRLGFEEGDKPIATYMFVGPTGVGKTELAKTLAKELFSSEESLIRIDMSEYSSKHEVSKLIGSAPGYVGYKEGGKLTEAVRKKPYSIILLDEFEKAHKDVYNIFLQVFDDGRLTDGLGKTIDFTNTVIILTSNVGVKDSQNVGGGVGFGGSDEEVIEKREKESLEKSLHKTFSPEFLNRLDGVINFNYLTKENIAEILEIEISKFKKKTSKMGYKVEFKKSAKEFLVEKGFNRKMGARPLKRAIKEHCDNLLVDLKIENKIKDGSKVILSHRKGQEKLSTTIS